MNWKKIFKALLFPHPGIIIALTPFAIAFLVYSMIYLGTESVPAIISYVLAAYTLTVWCIRIPAIVKYFQRFKKENKYAVLWLSDPRLRVNVSLFGTLIWNTSYAIFQLGLGFYHSSFWYCSLAGYYLCLAVMRFFLILHTKKHKPGEQMQKELKKYRDCGIVLLVMNLALALMIFFMVYWNRTFNHHQITAIAMAAYTFTAFTFAIINMVKYKKYNSPVYSAAKAISLASACVSLLTLESTMLTAFGDGTMDAMTQKIMLGASGGVISAFIIAMAINMIIKSKLKEQKNGR